MHKEEIIGLGLCPKRFPTVAAFFALRRGRQGEVIAANRDSLEDAVARLNFFSMIGYTTSPPKK